MTSERPIVQLRDVVMRFHRAGTDVTLFNGLTLELSAGRSVGISGASGSGKTTLLNLCAGIRRPTSGTIMVDGVDLSALPQVSLDRLRVERIGYVFQSFNLMPALSALHNVEVALRIAGGNRAEQRRARAGELLKRVGLGNRMHHKPAQLSFGQMQRVGIARALANKPRLLLADEPTASLEPSLARSIAELLIEVTQETGATLVVGSHDPAILDMMQERVSLAALANIPAGDA